MTERLANVDLRRGEYIVQSSSQTVAGFWISTGTPVRFSSTSSAMELGQAVVEALARSKQGVETPPRDAKLSQPLLDLVGVRDYAAYMKGTRSIDVDAAETPDGQQMKITPTRNEGARGGFTPIAGKAVTIIFASPGQLGEAIVRAFEDAT
jgi:hypothetical protein